MASVLAFFVLFYFFNFASLQGTGSGTDGNLRLCIVERRGSYKRAPKFCPILDEENSGVECVIGTDRLDCLRRISKGTVDFGVFSPEDLVAAQWADIDVLVTNEIKVRNKPFDRNVVAVVNRRILPDRSSTLHAVLRNSTLCHPGVGADDLRPLSDTLSGYLESLVLERSCDPELTLAENRIKALSGFFGKACKAGLWVPDKARDAQLKSQYPSLCAACRTPSKCASTDRFWGDTGALTCLGEAAGDVTWAEYSDVAAYFGLDNTTRRTTNSYPSTERFAFLCRDGTWLPLNAEPCVWLHRPWNVIVAKRKASEAVSKLAESLTNSSIAVDHHWRGALAALLENPAAVKEPLSPPLPPPDYLVKARGFREAYSQSGCDPPRHIIFCTTSFLEKNKCDWLSEAGAVYGITPPLQCIAKDYTEACMSEIRDGNADITVASSDWIVRGKRDFQVTPILHEVTPIIEKTNTIVAYVSKKSFINSFKDLRGKRAAFPVYDGAAWHSVLNYITENEKITCQDYLNNYFEHICAPGANDTFDKISNCYNESEAEALNWLLTGKADVAFVSMATYNMFINNPSQYNYMEPLDLGNITPLCPEENKKYCFINWSSLGHVYTKQNITQMKKQEIINVLESLDKMFGIRPPFSNPMFSMYGPYNHELNVIFHNNTMILGTDSVFDAYDRIGLNFERKFLNMTEFVCSFGAKLTPYWFVVTAVIMFNFVM